MWLRKNPNLSFLNCITDSTVPLLRNAESTHRDHRYPNRDVYRPGPRRLSLGLRSRVVVRYGLPLILPRRARDPAMLWKFTTFELLPAFLFSSFVTSTRTFGLSLHLDVAIIFIFGLLCTAHVCHNVIVCFHTGQPRPRPRRRDRRVTVTSLYDPGPQDFRFG